MKGPVTYCFILYLRIYDHTAWFRRSLGTALVSCTVVTDPQVYCEVIHDQAVNQMLFQWICIHAYSSHMIKIERTNSCVSVRSAMVTRCCVRPTPKKWFLKIVQVTMKTWCIWCHVGVNPCRLYIHLAFTNSGDPPSVVWRELGPAPPFPPMRVLEV